MSARDLALRALVTKHVADIATAAIKARRAELGDEMASGDRIGVTAPDEPELEVGMVYRTKPTGTATVTDRAAFTNWMASNYPDRVQVISSIERRWMGEAIKALADVAEHLITETPVVEPWAESEVLKLTEKARQACGPGGETDIPGVTYEPPKPGVVTVKLSDDGPAVIEQLWREGRIDLQSGEVLALPAGTP